LTEAAVEKPSDKDGAPKSDLASVVKPDEVKTAPAAGTPPMSDALAPSAPSSDVGKDQTRVADPAPAAKPEAPKSRGQIAAFISRKDSKIYVRQNFAPLFEAPVTIAASERPLGTHVFTAEVDRKDSNALHWSVVSLPTAGRIADKDEDSHLPRRQRLAGILPVAAKPVITPDRPAEALDRITVPPDVMARINEMLTTGGSIIVSDQGINQGETGEGTDFIVRMR
jgi:hypothetical protein